MVGNGKVYKEDKHVSLCARRAFFFKISMFLFLILKIHYFTLFEIFDLRTLWKAMEKSTKRTNMYLSVQEELFF